MEAIAATLPYLDVADQLPPGARVPEVPAPPDVLNWLERFEDWGMPNPGTWLDQPKWFMEDMRAAAQARDEARRKHAQATSVEAAWPSADEIAAMLGVMKRG